MTNVSIKNNYDLEERTAKFGEEIIKLAKGITESSVTLSITTQLIRSGTSVGANYCEADNAESKRDFRHKIGICKKEAREAMHWLRMVGVVIPELKEKAQGLGQEAKELNLIFSAIIHSADRNN